MFQRVLEEAAITHAPTPHPARLARLAGAVAVLLAVLGVDPAAAACHVAAFEQTQPSVGEGAGSVSLTVFLQGRQPSCEGTVDWSTQPGSATAGEDYTPGAGTLTFVAGDDREETITIGLLDDGADEPDEAFTVVLSNPSGGLSGTGGPATVTITDDDDAPQPTPSATGSPTPGETPSEDPSATPSDQPPSDGPSPTPTEDATPAESEEPTASDEPDQPPTPDDPESEPQPEPDQTTAEPTPSASAQPTPSATATSTAPSTTPPVPEVVTPSAPAALDDDSDADDDSGRLVPIVIGLLLITGLAAWLTRRAN